MVLDCTHAPAGGGDSILGEGRVVGTVTSAGWGHRTGKNIAMGLVEPDFADIGTRLEVEVIGAPVNAKVVEGCLYDPKNARVRA